MGEISVTKLLVVGVLIVLLFGTKKLRTLGSDLGLALKGFKKAMAEDAPVQDPDTYADTPAEKIDNKH